MTTKRPVPSLWALTLVLMCLFLTYMIGIAIGLTLTGGPWGGTEAGILSGAAGSLPG